MGSLLFKMAFLLGAPLGLAVFSQAQAQVTFSAEVDRQEIAADDSLSLKLKVEIEGSQEGTGSIDPSYTAPDFEEINQYHSSFIQSVFNNGKISLKSTKQVTKVLRPKRVGTFKIEELKVVVNGRTYTALPVSIRVLAAGQGAQPPRAGPGSQLGGGYGLPGTQKGTQGLDYFMRAELSKSKVVEGEQVVVSYYLYRRVSIFNKEVSKYPIFEGFLREDLDLPVLQNRDESETVVVGGIPYRKELLARYAAYPLRDGKLSIDSMSLKFNYYNQRNSKSGDAEDGFGNDPFFRFFQPMTPKAAKIQSDVIQLEVMSLPEQDKPASFTGAVGVFDIVGAVDRYSVKANEALTLTLKIEGRGNINAFKEPKINLPDSVEVYESKSKARTSKAGVGEKIFETLLIPREVGKHAIPPIEISYFDSDQRKYVVKNTAAIELTVAPGVGGVGLSPRPKPTRTGEADAERTLSPIPDQDAALLRALKPLDSVSKAHETSLGWKLLYALSFVAFVVFALIVWMDQKRRRRRIETSAAPVAKKSDRLLWKQRLNQLKSLADSAYRSSDRLQMAQVYREIAEVVIQALVEATASNTLVEVLGAAEAEMLSREALKQRLPEEAKKLWPQIEEILNMCDRVNFACPPGSELETQALQTMPQWIQAALGLLEKVDSALKKPAGSGTQGPEFKI